jgi:acyl transferase domain-containing protein
MAPHYALGDPIEIEGLKWLLEFSLRSRFCAGSIKSNMGHHGSSRSCRIDKTILAMNHKMFRLP